MIPGARDDEQRGVRTTPLPGREPLVRVFYMVACRGEEARGADVSNFLAVAGGLRDCRAALLKRTRFAEEERFAWMHKMNRMLPVG